MDETKRKKAFFVLVGLIALVVYFQFLLKPKINSLSSAFAEVNQMFAKVNIAKENIKNIPEFQKNINALTEKITLSEKDMPAQEKTSALLGRVSEVAQSTDVKILAIVPLQETRVSEDEKEFLKENYRQVAISIEARAAYHNLGLFINELEQTNAFMKVTDIKIQSDPQSPELHKVNLVVSAYCLTAPPPAEEK